MVIILTTFSPRLMAANSSAPAFTCPRCTNLPYKSEQIFNDRILSDYLSGDILKIKESVHAVCHSILDAAASVCGMSPYPRPSGDSEDILCKARPAILIEHRPKALGGTAQVCLCATFRGKSRRDRLPEVLRYFCVTLHPHQAIAFEPNTFHLHTVPEWTTERSGKPNGWVIAVEYTSSGEIVGRWPNKARADQQSSSSFTIVDDHDSQLQLTVLCGDKWRDFLIYCSRNKDAFRFLKDDYEVSLTASTLGHNFLMVFEQEWKRNRSYQAVQRTTVRCSGCMNAQESTDTEHKPTEYVYILRHTD